jgi:hypothetical protein
MESASITNELVTGAKIQMVGIGKDKIKGWEIANIMWITKHIKDQSFDRCFGSHRHKDWRLDFNSIQEKCPRSGFAFGSVDRKLKFRHEEWERNERRKEKGLSGKGKW